MAARTLTYTPNYSVANAVEQGLQCIAWDFNSGATKFGTLSDMVLLGKVPNGAIITTKSVRFGANGSAAAHFSLVLLAVDALGTFSVNATLMPSLTGSATAAVFTDVIPVKLSLSDDRAVQYAVLALNCTTGATETVSFSIQGSINYVADGRGL